MLSIKPPKTIRWIFYCAFLFLLLMSLYRLGIHFFFSLFKLNSGEFSKAFGIGFLFDLRVVAGFSLLIFLMSIFPAFHFFKTSFGRNTAFLCYLIFSCVLLIFYSADFAHIFLFDKRLDFSIFSAIARNTPDGLRFKQGTPWLAILVSIAVATWLFMLLIKTGYNNINKTKVVKLRKNKRSYWQLSFVLLCLISIYGTVSTKPLSKTWVAKKLQKTAASLCLNPIVVFFNKQQTTTNYNNSIRIQK